jgi:Fic family protein
VQLQNRLLPGYGDHFNPLLRCIVRRTRGYLESTINPATGGYYLPRVTVRLFGEDAHSALTLGGYLREAYQEAEEFCRLLQQRVKGAGFFKTLLLRRLGSSMEAGRKTVLKLLGSAPDELSDEDDDDIEDDDGAQTGRNTQAESEFKNFTPAEVASLNRCLELLRQGGNNDPKLDAVTLAPERLSALRRVATIESIGSSTRIEGSKLSDREVERLLASLEIKSFATRDEQEVAGYAEVMELVFRAWEDIAVTENHIKQLHRDLLVHSEKDTWHRGSYKTSSNSVAAFDEDGRQIGIVFETATPFDTPRLMAELVGWVTSEREQRHLHPLLVIAVFTVVFLEIHPFQDGNGRLSRILTTLLLLQAGYAYVPYSSLESVIEQSKEGYYLALRQTQGSIRSDAPNWQPWITFLLRALQQQMRRLAKKIEREKIVLSSLPDLALRILDHARDHGRVSMGEVIQLTGVSRNTLKQQFRQLVDKGHLAKHGGGRTTWYTLP